MAKAEFLPLDDERVITKNVPLAVSFGAGRIALEFGNQKINLHQLGHEFEPKAQNVRTGSKVQSLHSISEIQMVTS